MSELNNDHNVYILGAGFSANRGLPLINGFMDAMRDAREWLIQQGRRQEAEAITKVLDFRLTAASAAYRVRIDLDNIEELFSLAAASDLTLSRTIQLAIAATIDYKSKISKEPLANFRLEESDAFGYKKWAGWKYYDELNKMMHAPLYAFYVNALIGGLNGKHSAGTNTFVTFNYDCLVEQALNSLSIPFDYGFKPKSVNYDATAVAVDHWDISGVKVLKLHGSVSWALPGKQGRKLTVYGSYADVAERNLCPEIVAPTWRKIFDGQLNDIWDAAIKELTTASRLIIIGFSMPQTDMHFKYLLAAGLKKNISLREIIFVDPERERIAKRGEAVFGEMMRESNKLIYTGATLDGFVCHNWGGKDSRGMNDIGRALHPAIQQIGWTTNY